MTQKTPSNEAPRKKDGVIDQRQQQIDPAQKATDYAEWAETSVGNAPGSWSKCAK